jgi:uncharacterized membrane protein YecN with MAPEG domain
MTVPDTYGYVLLVAVIIAFEIILIGFLFPGRTRGRVFNKEFLEKHFGEEHKNAVGTEIGKEGYPDTGNGWYSKHLSYKDWFDFNNAQRAHYNFIEMAPSTFVMLFIAGLYFPIPAAAIGLALAVCRMIYSCGYANSGPTGRVIGAIGNDLCLLGLLGLSFASGVMWVKGDAL